MIFRNLFRNQDTTDLRNPAPWFRSLFSYEATSGERVTVESSLGVPTVYRCVNILANSVAMLPFQTFKKTAKGRERDKAHQVSFVLERRPNPYQSP
ncbi:portal protein, partial [Bacillus cereus]